VKGKTMTVTVNVHEAKTHFSRLLARVSGGEEIVIARAGKPVARLVPLTGAMARRAPGSADGLVYISDDFDAPLPEAVLEGFEG
jgi:prevent-host-death family protein